jgi:hypothetical protein
MLSPEEIAAIKKDLATLKNAYESLTGGLRQVIQAWILDAEKTLAKEAKTVR